MSNQPWCSSWGVEVTRDGLVESFHHVAACALDERGNVIFSAGDVDAPVFLRSTAKPFIAATAIEAGARERFSLEPHEIAVMAASHTGQPFHIDAVRSILRKIGMHESSLLCGPHAPYNEEAAQQLRAAGITPGPVYNNCSGKHAGILALCVLTGADPRTYLEPQNPAQIKILELCARVSGQRVADFVLGVDGCGIPVYATPLRNAALSFMHLATLKGIDERDAAALQIVRDAMIAHPEYVSGTGEFDTRLMLAGAGSVATKGGAEGVSGTAFIGAGVGLVCKVLDGAARGRAPAVLSAIRQLGLLPESALTNLADLERPVVYNRAGRAVGEVRAASTVAILKASTSI
ncbi:MAG TPA: asparaginase [Candidatus Eremiobacteraceae bacterium]|nr:asparaginase [Candidatus Eremiobacteraceae bacterium]